MQVPQTRLEDRQPTYGFGGTLSGERRELAALVEASERYAAEARRLVPTQVNVREYIKVAFEVGSGPGQGQGQITIG